MDLNSTFNSSVLSVSHCLEAANEPLARALVIFYVLLIPLFGYVLYVGCTEFKKQRSGPSKKRSLGHSDVLTFNMVAVESLNILGVAFMYASLFHDKEVLQLPGNLLYFQASVMQLLFHSLICLDRYTAVVHPVTYLRLKNKSGVVVRNVCIAAIWLLSSGSLVSFFSNLARKLLGLLVNVLSFSVISFSCVSVLRALIRPTPGDGGGDRKRVNHSKRAAFNIIMTILGALLFRFIFVFVFYADFSTHTHSVNACVLTVLILWFKIPSSLVLPLLFLHRAGKLPGCKPKT